MSHDLVRIAGAALGETCKRLKRQRGIDGPTLAYALTGCLGGVIASCPALLRDAVLRDVSRLLRQTTHHAAWPRDRVHTAARGKH